LVFVITGKNMKRFCFILAFALLVISCKKDDETHSQLPEWLQQKIEMDYSEVWCEGCDVEVYSFEGKTYYSLYCGHWSCLYCHVFTEGGEPVEWEQEDWLKFVNEKKLVKTVPMCQE
jgi:hypothetical protein